MNKTLAVEYEGIKRIDEYYGDDIKRSYAKNMAKVPHFRTISELTNMYSKPLDKMSHGEAFIDFFIKD